MFIFVHIPALSWLSPVLVVYCCGELSCSTSSPGGHLVDGLPPVADSVLVERNTGEGVIGPSVG